MHRNFKKLVSILLVIIIVFGSAPLAGFVGLDLSEINLFSTKAEATTSGTCGENLTWTFDTETYTLKISGTGAMTNYSGASPWYGLRSCIKTVIIDNGVTSIGDKAFYKCELITDIIISDDVTKIGDLAFYNCEELTSIIISKNIISIGYKVFESCYALSNITVEMDNATYSSDEFGVLFNKDKTVLIQYPIGNTRTNYTVPDSVILINDFSFYYSSNLISVKIGSGTTNIGESAFEDSSIQNISFGNSVTDIGQNAFNGCSAITSVSIGDSVKNIEYRAFCGCGALESFTIGKGLENISDQVFYSCKNLTSITVDPANLYFSNDEYGVLFDKNKTKLIQYPVGNQRTNYEIPDNVLSIGNEAFDSCTYFTNITIPEGVKSIGDSAFSDCINLNNITIPDSVISMGYRILDNTGVYNNSSNWENGVLYIGKHLINAETYLTNLFVNDETITIAGGAFGFCRSLTSVTIPNSVVSIGRGAFDECSSLISVEIPDSVTTIGDMAFFYCTNLEYVHISASVTSIGENAFAGVSAYICSETDDCYVKEYAEANGYTFVLCDGHNAEEHTHSYLPSVTKEANCTETGISTYSCECGDSYTEEIEKIGHTAGEWEVIAEATCTVQGRKDKKCTVCGTITKIVTIPFADHLDSNGDGLCDVCDKISNVELVKNIYISIATPENRTINYMESVKLYATTANLPEGYKIKWKIEGEGVTIKSSLNGKTCTVTANSTGNVIIKAYIVDSNGNIVTDENGKQVSDSEYFYSEANLWLRIVYFFKKLFGISISTAQVFKGII